MAELKKREYFPYEIQISRENWERLKREIAAGAGVPSIVVYRTVARHLNSLPFGHEQPVAAGLLNMYALQMKIFRYLTDRYFDEKHPPLLEQAVKGAGYDFTDTAMLAVLESFVGHFPGGGVLAGRETPAEFITAEDRKRTVVKELLLLRIAAENRAIESFRRLLDDRQLTEDSPYREVMGAVETELSAGPAYQPLPLPLPALLRAPLQAFPDSLAGQLEYIRTHWAGILPPELLAEIVTAFDIVKEEEREWWGTPGPPTVPEFDRLRGLTGAGYEYPEYERFSADADWMSNVVLLAKMVYVWLDQLSKRYGYAMNRLDEIPDEELDRLARWGFTGLWLIGIWERSPASQKIKHICGNHDAVASAYSLYDYVIAGDLGGEGALDNLRERCARRGIRLSADMVPNHTGIYSKWTQEHPDWFVQLDYPPYPGYRFTGPDLSFSSHMSMFIEDGYWNHSDAAVVFKHIDHGSGRVRYIYHGNDGTSTPWNDTAQLDYLLPEVREAVIQTILHVARKFPIIRFDAAMTLAKKHYQRLWFPQPGGGGGIPSRAEHAMTREEFDRVFPHEFWREVVDRVAAEVPDTLLLAEAFWLMEGYFVRTLGMHRVYNSAFMNMLKMEENAKYRQTVKNVLEFNPEILKRFVNFMNNPDERTAIDQFGKEGKYIGAAVLLVTMPGLPMIGHGQIEGFREKYGMEYRRAYWEEEPDEHLIRVHEEKIFPLMRRRYLFSGSANFVFYDFFAGNSVNEDVFAYSNRFGRERGIVVYHNRFGDTKGWIRTSTPFAVKNAAGETELRRTTLGEALEFHPDGSRYYLFREYNSGLEYLRTGREMAEQGLYVELGAYEYQAFLDFREITDDEYGNWGKLWHRLEHRPVPSIEAELKEVKYEGLLAPFRSLLDALLPHVDVLVGPPSRRLTDLLALLTDRLSPYLAAVETFTGRKGAPQELRALLARLNAAGSAESLDESLHALLSEKSNRMMLFVLLTLEPLLDEEDGAEPGGETADRFGLLRAAEAYFRDAEKDPFFTCPWGTGREALLLRAILSHGRFFLGDKRERPLLLQGLFRETTTREFLAVHWSGGQEWFSRERLEILFAWLAVRALLIASSDPAERDRVAVDGALLRREAADLLDLAEKACYHPEAFLALAGAAE
jgi:glycosidase